MNVLTVHQRALDAAIAIWGRRLGSSPAWSWGAGGIALLFRQALRWGAAAGTLWPATTHPTRQAVGR